MPGLFAFRASAYIDLTHCPSSWAPLKSEFCHLHLPSFLRAFRLAADHGPRTLAPQSIGPDEHVWCALCIIVLDPLLSRYVREHERGRTFILEAMASLGRVLRNWSVNLKRDVSPPLGFCA